MTLPKNINDSSTKREVSDFPVGERAATITYRGSSHPTVRFHTILRVTKTQVVTGSASGEIKWSLGKYEHDFHEVGTRYDTWAISEELYAPGDPRIADALARRREYEYRQERSRKVQNIIAPLTPTRDNYGLPSTSDDTLRKVIADLSSLLPSE